LGAGVAGLQAAHLLESKGVKVLVLEGSNRVGGRMMTTPDGVNLGGVEIGDGYKRLIEAAKRCQVELVEPSAPASRDILLNIKGQNIVAKNWATSEYNPLADTEKTILPPLLESSFLKNNPLKKLDDWCKPAFKEFDTPLSYFLKKQGASDAAIALANTSGNYNDIHSVSALHLLRSQLYRVAGGSVKTMRIKGGSQRLPEAMASVLKSKVVFQKAVSAIQNDAPRKITVRCTDGTSYTANKVICTIPLPALKKVAIAKLTDAHRPFINKTQYTQILQVIVKPKVEFWKSDGYPLSMWTDSPIERVLNEGERLVLWINGIGTKPYLNMTNEAIGALALNKLAEIRPSTKGQLDITYVNFWHADRPFSGGAYYETQAGEAGIFEQAIRPIGHLHFAGEHTAVLHRGMEGAMESAERAVTELQLLK
jgi:monoamine oxidase